MSISSALSNALSGLTVASRSADIVSSNVANAMTEGYGVRSLNTGARVVGDTGTGVRITGVTRHEDAVLLANRRHADADAGFHETQRAYLQRLETLVGVPGEPGSLSDRVADFEARLVAAANNPQSQPHLAASLEAGRALAGALGDISKGIQAERLDADTRIDAAVGKVNANLQRLAELNDLLKQAPGGARDVSALLDNQARLLDEISGYMTLQTRRDETGALKIYSADGRALLDGRAAKLAFEPARVMDPFMISPPSGLGDLTLNGRPLEMTGARPALPGGTLGALFGIRDSWGIEAQAQIDGIARDLAERFSGAGFDPTLAPGAAGLFTDAGAPILAGNELGLSQRLRLNAAVDPQQGGAVWRLRDGLGAAVEGPSGDAGFLLRQIDALAAARPTASAAFPAADRSFTGLASEYLTGIGFARQGAEMDLSHAAGQQALFKEAELAQGVDTDAEMQKLMRIEQAYAANARVVESAQQMLDDLMRMI
jgi:flagellar hook-associated protein 1 FlgK